MEHHPRDGDLEHAARPPVARVPEERSAQVGQVDADLVAVATIDTTLKVVTDFTGDRELSPPTVVTNSLPAGTGKAA